MTLEIQTLPPQVWPIIVGLATILLRWLEKKLLSNKAKKVKEKLDDAMSTAQSTRTISKLQEAQTANDSLIKALSATNFPNSFIKK